MMNLASVMIMDDYPCQIRGNALFLSQHYTLGPRDDLIGRPTPPRLITSQQHPSNLYLLRSSRTSRCPTYLTPQ